MLSRSLGNSPSRRASSCQIYRSSNLGAQPDVLISSDGVYQRISGTWLFPSSSLSRAQQKARSRVTQNGLEFFFLKAG